MALAAAVQLLGTETRAPMARPVSMYGPVSAVVVDHRLQPGSGEQTERAAAQLSALGYLDVVVRVAEPGPAGLGPEGAARAARYAVLDAEADRHDAVVLLGHTLDDQAETVLLGLARGSGPRSLAGMAAVAGRYRRPLLGLRRSCTRQACAELGLRPWSDPQNADPRFTRVRVRDRVLPVLEAELGGAVAPALARTAELAREDADLLDRLAAELYPKLCPDEGGPVCALLLEAPRALRSRVLKGWLTEAGAGDVGAAHIGRVEALVTDWHGQRWVDVPGLRVARQDGRLIAERPARPAWSEGR